MVKVRLSLLDKISLFLSVYSQLVMSLLKISWYSPFLIIAVFQLLGMAMFLWFYAPVLISIIKPILSLFVPAQAFHYPRYYLALPAIYAGYETFILGPTIWILMLVVVIRRLDGAFTRQWLTMQEGFGIAFDRYFRLLFIWFIETVLVLVILYVPSVVLKDMMRSSPNMSAGIGVILQAAGLLVTAMLIYGVVGVVLDNKGVGEAIIDGIIGFFRYPLMTFSIIFIPNILRLVLNALLSDFAPRIIGLLNPDLIPVIMVFYIITGIFINFFIYGAAVLLYRRLE
jgi:hypothetical protein